MKISRETKVDIWLTEKEVYQILLDHVRKQNLAKLNGGSRQLSQENIKINMRNDEHGEYEGYDMHITYIVKEEE